MQLRARGRIQRRIRLWGSCTTPLQQMNERDEAELECELCLNLGPRGKFLHRAEGVSN